MKKLSFLLAVLMVVMCMPFAAMTTISAAAAPDGYTLTAEDTAAVNAGKPFKVAGSADVYYANYNAAFKAAGAGAGVLEFLSNVHVGTAGGLAVPAGSISVDRMFQDHAPGYVKCDMTIEGHGFTVTDNYANGGGYGFKIDNYQTYTVTVKNLTVKSSGFFQVKGNIVFTDVNIYGANATTAEGTYNGAILIQKDTHIVFNGNSYVESNANIGNVGNAVNPVFRFNETTNIKIDIAGNTEIKAYSSMFHGTQKRPSKLPEGTAVDVFENVTFNIYDNANLHTVYESNILFCCEWKGIGINVYGGTLSTVGKNPVIYIGNANSEGSYANIYGGTLEDTITCNPTYCTLNIYKGNLILNGVAYKTDAFTQVAGASIRHTEDSSGIRFRSIIPQEVINSIAAVDESYKIGTIIVPYDYLVYAKDNMLTKEALEGVQYLDIEAKNSLACINDQGDLVINAAMTNILGKNLDRDFVATGYITWTDAKGSTWTVYSNPNPTKDDARNVREIAWTALTKVSDNETEGYAYTSTVYATAVGKLVEAGEPKFSKYDEAAMKNIAKFVK